MSPRCWRSAPEDVPAFHQEHQKNWLLPFRDWLKQFGLFPLTCKIDKPDAFKYISDTGAVYIAGGCPWNGSSHACVYKGGQLLHDPHPDGKGLFLIEDVTFLVPLEPLSAAQIPLVRGQRSAL